MHLLQRPNRFTAAIFQRGKQRHFVQKNPLISISVAIYRFENNTVALQYRRYQGDLVLTRFP